MVDTLIITYGAKGSVIHHKKEATIKVPAYKAKKVVDPTGCGDAFRAGLMFGLKKGLSTHASARIGAWIASKSVEKKGTQNHSILKKELVSIIKKL